MLFSGYKTYAAAATLALVCLLEMAGVDVVPGIDQSNAFGFLMESVMGGTIRAAISGFKA